MGTCAAGIPERDLDALGDYWQIMPGLRAKLFDALRNRLCPSQAAAF